MKKQKSIVIIIPGAKFIKSKNKFIQLVILWLYKLTGTLHPVYSNYADGWKEFFSRKNSHVIWMHWSRGFTKMSKFFAVRKLCRLLRQYKNEKITIVGMSLGGEIALESSEKFKNLVKKIILVGSTNEKKKFDTGKTKIINIYSKKDKFQRMAIELLSPFFGSVILDGSNVKNINLPGVAHDEFFANKCVSAGRFKNKTISEVIEYYIEDEN